MSKAAGTLTTSSRDPKFNQQAGDLATVLGLSAGGVEILAIALERAYHQGQLDYCQESIARIEQSITRLRA